jgi:hypothetical protein
VGSSGIISAHTPDLQHDGLFAIVVASVGRRTSQGLVRRERGGEDRPQILEYARRPDLGYMSAFFLRRAGKFRTHADEVLMLYDELVGSDWKAIEVSIAEGLRLLGDPRGVAILMRVKDHNSTILREKARTLDRLQGRD